MKGFSVLKNAEKGPVRPEEGSREKNFRYLKAEILPSMASAMEALSAGQASGGFKVVRGETRDIRVEIYSPRAAAPGVAVKAARAKVADFADSNPKELS